MHLRSITFSTLLLTGAIPSAADAQAKPRPKPNGPGYYGTTPSPTGQRLLAKLTKQSFVDRAGKIGGGTWKIARGAMVPHPLGPGRADVHELRTARTKGPHIVLSQGRCAIFLPTRNDGDVAALLELLGRPGGDSLNVTSTSQEWKLALRRTRGLGVARDGVRVGLLRDPKSHAFTLLVWNVGAEKIDLRGLAKLKIDGQQEPVVMRWPPKIKATSGSSRIQLPPGSYYEQKVARSKAAKSSKDRAKRRALFLFEKLRLDKTDADAARQLRSPTITWAKRAATSQPAKKSK